MYAPPGAKRYRTSDSGHLWASLPEDLVRLVAWRVLAGGDLLDYIQFRSVCTGWRSGAVSPRGRGVTDPRFHPRRWMMLPEGHCLYPGHPDLDGYARFLNLDTGALVRVRIPLLEDHLAIASVDGLLLLLGDQYQQGTMCLLHPFTGDITELPPLATLLPKLLDTKLYNRPVLYRIKCLASRVCASASFRDGVVAVMLALGEANHVAFATSLEQQWNISSWKYPSSAARLGFQGKLYMLDTFKTCRFLQIDPPLQDVAGSVGGGTLQPPNLIATIPKSKFIIASDLVECDSEILVLAFKKAKSMSRILACKLEDLVLQKRFIPIKDIGNNTLFLGERCMSISSNVLSTVKGDNVVFEFESPGKPYLAQYHMSSGKWFPAIDDCSLYGRAPGPSHLIHYITSCCTRSLWNRGIVLRMTTRFISMVMRRANFKIRYMKPNHGDMELPLGGVCPLHCSHEKLVEIGCYWITLSDPSP